MNRRFIIIIALALALLPILAAFQIVGAETISELQTGIKIDEIKIGGGSEPKEYVELFNDSSNTIDLNGLQIEYAKSSFSPAYCQSTNWKSHANPTSSVSTKLLSGGVPPYGFAVIIMSLTDNTSGALRLSTVSETNFKQYDLVGWGSTSSCYAKTPATLPPAGQVIKRTFDKDGHLIVSADENNSEDFSLNATPLPGDDQCLINDCYEVPIEPMVEVPAYLPVNITELLPDPASPLLDSQDEYIELYNPNPDPVNLNGYRLITASASSGYSYAFSDLILQPGEYKAIYSKDSHLVLANGGSYAWLEAPDGSIMFQTDWYPDTINSDQVWAFSDNSWQLTDTITPNAQNQINLIADEETINEVEEESINKTCPIGKFRNPQTGRCKSNIIASAIMPCKTNQIRNPDTNRCRNVVVASSVKDCEEGYERNPDTNRCRKIVTTTKSNTTKPPPAQSRNNYLLIAAVSACIIGYSIYEYRLDIQNVYNNIKQRQRRQIKEVLQ